MASCSFHWTARRPAAPIDLFNPEVVPTKAIALGVNDLAKAGTS